LIAISREEMKKYNHETGDTEGIVNYPLSIKNIKLAALFIERKDMIKISFRSKDDFSVRDFSSMHFEGGGHKNASGGKSLESLKSTVARFIELLPSYKKQLTGK
jgi:phosphoesterase RecJ-like protein